jgi:hypothetical protein
MSASGGHKISTHIFNVVFRQKTITRRNISITLDINFGALQKNFPNSMIKVWPNTGPRILAQESLIIQNITEVLLMVEANSMRRND